MTDARVLLISPVRNEAANLPQVAAALVAQRRPPDLWLVVDDGSDDETPTVLRNLARRVRFMEVVRTPPGFAAPGHDRLAAAAPDRAFNHGLTQVDWREFTHLGKLDGDTVVPDEFIEQLLERFDAEPTLGVAGGVLVEPHDGDWREMRTPPEWVSACARLYSRECFEAIGGMQPRMGADVIATTYARMRGYATRNFGDLRVKHLRPMGSAQGILRGRARHGAYQYIVHYQPWWIAARSAMVAARLDPPIIGGVAFAWGYAAAAIRRTPRVEDPEFRAYMHRLQRARLHGAVRRCLRRHEPC